MATTIHDLDAPKDEWSEWTDIGTHGADEVFHVIYTAFGNAVSGEVRFQGATGPSTTGFKYAIDRRTGTVSGTISIRVKGDGAESKVKCVLVQ